MTSIYVIGSVAIDLTAKSKGKASALFPLLRASGFELTDNSASHALLAIDHNQKKYKKYLNQGGSSKRAILLRLEPKSVFPSQYKKRIEKKYQLIITPGAIPSENLETSNFGWPYQYHLNPTLPDKNDLTIEQIVQQLKEYGGINNSDLAKWAQRPILLSMIAGNWVSPVRDNNYGIRRKLAKEFPEHVLKIYGPLWNESFIKKIQYRLRVALFAVRNMTIPNLKNIYGNLFSRYNNSEGFVSDKHEILSKSKFTLVIENSSTYVSEKIFDALINGSIPFYIGPPLKDVSIPPGIVIENNGTSDGIIRHIADLDDTKIRNMLSGARDFLTSKDFESHWIESSVYSQIQSRISIFLSVN
jgi:hypothetical protein